MSVSANFVNEDNLIYLSLTIGNTTDTTIREFVLQIRQNYFGLKPETLPASFSVGPLSSKTVKLKLTTLGNRDTNPPSVPLVFTVGLKCSLDVFLFKVPCLFHIFMVIIC